MLIFKLEIIELEMMKDKTECTQNLIVSNYKKVLYQCSHSPPGETVAEFVLALPIVLCISSECCVI